MYILITPKIIEEILSLSLKRGGDFSEVFFEETFSVLFRLDDKKIEEVTSGEDIGVGIRVIKGDRTFYGYTNDITPNGLRKLAEEISYAVFEGEISRIISLENKKSQSMVKIIRELRSVELKEGADFLRLMDEKARKYALKIVQFTGVIRSSDQKVVIANSEGEFKEDRRIRSVIYGLSVAYKDGIIQTGYESYAKLSGWELFNQELLENIAFESARRAVLMLEAEEAPAGVMPVVISSKAGGVLVHEAVGHGLEGDLVEKKVSVYSGKIGEKVASELVTLVDTGTLEGNYGSFSFDDEGVPSQYNILIEKGILKGYMHSRLTARKMGVKPTGNGRRQSFRFPPIPRMTNTYLLPGKSSFDEIINRVEKGLYVVKMGGGQVDTISGDFVFAVEEGYLIEKGKITKPVRGATLIGNGPKILESIEMVGNDLGFTPGTCGKDMQGVPVTDGMPTILIPQITVGGTKREE
ncbi:MAG: TldD/PmbA family protein [Dictyoglomaceae bacterium]